MTLSRPPDALWRPLGFFVLMVGLGLRLDTDWQGMAWLLILVGGGTAGWGLWLLARRTAFVPTDGAR